MPNINAETLTASTWLLLGAHEDENKEPVHGVKLAFHAEPYGLRGAMINWRTGDEIPLASLCFNESLLELQMSPDNSFQGETPTLRMNIVGEHFEGYWFNSANEQLPTPKLKIVRYGTERAASTL